MNAEQTINAVAIESVKHFTTEFVNSTPAETVQEEGLGIDLSHCAQWDGIKIMRVFRSALEDANYHAEAAQVEEMIKAAESDKTWQVVKA